MLCALACSVCTLTEESYFKNLKGLSSLVQLRGMECPVRWLKQITMGLFHHYRYRAFNRYILCKHLSLLALGWAVLTIVPIPTGLLRPRSMTRMLLLLSRAFRYIPVFKMSKMIVSGGDSNPDVGGGRVSRTPPYRPLVCVPELYQVPAEHSV